MAAASAHFVGFLFSFPRRVASNAKGGPCQTRHSCCDVRGCSKCRDIVRRHGSVEHGLVDLLKKTYSGIFTTIKDKVICCFFFFCMLSVPINVPPYLFTVYQPISGTLRWRSSLLMNLFPTNPAFYSEGTNQIQPAEIQT